MQEQEKTSETKPARDELGRLLPGGTANPAGRLPDTEEKKLAKKVLKELVAEYKESLAEVLPNLSPILKEKALTGDIQAIKEVHDRVMGKPDQSTDVKLEGRLVIQISKEIADKNDIDAYTENNSEGQEPIQSS